MATYGPFARGQLLRIETLYWINQTKLALSAAQGATTITVRDATGYASPNPIVLNPSADPRTEEHRVVASVSGNVITLTVALSHAHSAGEVVGELANPDTAALALKIPSTAAATAPALSNDSTGRYHVNSAVADAAASSGLGAVRTLATGAVQAADEATLQVEVSAF